MSAADSTNSVICPVPAGMESGNESGEEEEEITEQMLAEMGAFSKLIAWKPGEQKTQSSGATTTDLSSNDKSTVTFGGSTTTAKQESSSGRTFIDGVSEYSYSDRLLIDQGTRLWTTDAAEMISDVHCQFVSMHSSLIRLRGMIEEKKGEELSPIELANAKRILREVRDTSLEQYQVSTRLLDVETSLQEKVGKVGKSTTSSLFKQVITNGGILIVQMKKLKPALMVAAIPIAGYFIYRKMRA